jgi:hypothetical protein
LKRPRILTLILAVSLCSLLGAALPAAAQQAGPATPELVDAAAPDGADAVQAVLGSAITYQGSLKKNGQPVNATCSFQFSLWDAASGGAQTGATQTVDNAPVQAGVFTVRLDFGNQFTGDARWIQAAALAPRQLLTAAPYAIGLRPGAVVRSAASADALYVEKTAANSVAIHGKATQAGGTGVLGESSSWAGVWGQSTSASGVVGRSAGQFAGGVYGENTGQGYGVYGKAANNVAVLGESGSFDAVLGITTAPNRIGVKGVANSAGAVGVWGESAANTGVYGQSGTAGGAALWGNNTAGGVALRANGTAIQNADKGGLVKALVHVQRSGVIDRCYNGVNGASTNGCGFTVQHTEEGFYRIDFGFRVVDRFVQATSEFASTFDLRTTMVAAITNANRVNTVEVYSRRVEDATRADAGFWLAIH